LSPRRTALIASILGSGIVFLDGTMVNVALPAIRASLHGGLAQQQWVVEGYLLTLAALLLVGGSLGDLFGRRRVFRAGLLAFALCSLLCAISPSAGLLIAARTIQGVAGALLVPSALALIMDTFPESERAGAIGSWTAWAGIFTVIGPLGGGALIQAASWRWIFAINIVPVAIALVLLGRLPDDRHSRGRVDFPGAILCALGLAGPVFALIEEPTFGWGDAGVLIPLLAGVTLLAAFVAWERRAREPMMPLSLFSVRNFTVGNLTTLCLYAGLSVATFFVVLYVQQVGGYTPLEAGTALLPLTILMFTLSRRFGTLADRLGPHLFMGAGPLVAGGGLLLRRRPPELPHRDPARDRGGRAGDGDHRGAAHGHGALLGPGRALGPGQWGQQCRVPDGGAAGDRRARRRGLGELRRPAGPQPALAAAERTRARGGARGPLAPAGDRPRRGAEYRAAGGARRARRCLRARVSHRHGDRRGAGDARRDDRPSGDQQPAPARQLRRLPGRGAGGGSGCLSFPREAGTGRGSAAPGTGRLRASSARWR